MTVDSLETVLEYLYSEAVEDCLETVLLFTFVFDSVVALTKNSSRHEVVSFSSKSESSKLFDSAHTFFFHSF